MFNIDIVKDKDIGLEYECIKLNSDRLPDDIDTFFPRDGFAHGGCYSVWDYIIGNFIKIKSGDIIIRCEVPTDWQIDESELLSYKSNKFLEIVRLHRTGIDRKIWLGGGPQCWNKMVFVLRSENSDLLYGKPAYDNFSYLDI